MKSLALFLLKAVWIADRVEGLEAKTKLTEGDGAVRKTLSFRVDK